MKKPNLHASFFNRSSSSKRGDWFRIENKKSDDVAVADIYIYDEIGYWGTTAQDFVREVAALDVDEINLHLNSPGGDVFDGIAIYNSLKQNKANVTVYIEGLAASAASFIAQAGDKVIMARNATMMIHDAWGFAIGNEQVMLDTADLLGKLSDNIADIYLQRAGGTVDEWRALMKEEVWYSSSEAKEAGLVDEVIDADTDDEDESAENKWDLSIFNHAGRGDAPSPFEVRRRVLSNRLKEAPRMGVKNTETVTPAAPVEPTDVNPTEDNAHKDEPESVTSEPPVPTEPSVVTESAVENKANLTFVLNGVETTDIRAVQAHITNLETFRTETLENGRRSFVQSLAKDNKISAVQVEQLTNFALDLTESQYENWCASWQAAPQLSMFANHGGGNGSGPIASTENDEIAQLEGIIRQHKLANMPQEQLEKTSSYIRLQQLKSNQS